MPTTAVHLPEWRRLPLETWPIEALRVEVEELRAFVRQVLAIDHDTENDGRGEVFYYISPDDFAAVMERAGQLLPPGAQDAHD